MSKVANGCFLCIQLMNSHLSRHDVMRSPSTTHANNRIITAAAHSYWCTQSLERSLVGTAVTAVVRVVRGFGEKSGLMLLLAVNWKWKRFHIFSGLVFAFPEVLMTVDQVGASHILSCYWKHVLHKKHSHVSVSPFFNRTKFYHVNIWSCYWNTLCQDKHSHISLFAFSYIRRK